MSSVFKKLRLTSLLTFLALLLVPQISFAAFNSVFNETGQYTLAVDGGGNQSGANYQITIEKPAGATVHRAFAVVAAIPGRADPGAGALSFDFGAGNVTPNLSVLENSGGPSPINTRYGDVTADLSAALNAAPDGNVNITVTENAASGSDWDGSALLVIWNDPAATLTTVGIDLGAATTGQAPSITYTVGAPLQVNNFGFEALIGLGISFSTGTGAQISSFTFENNLITATAGGFEDGALANGALWTIGGFGDTPSRTDNDELYDVSDLITDGSTQLTTDFLGGTQDDYLIVQWIQVRNPYGVIIASPSDGEFATSEPNYDGTAPINNPVDLTWEDSNGTTIATLTVNSDPTTGAWSAPAQGFGDGTYVLTASSTTVNGTFTDVATFTIDTIAPVLTIATPADGSATTDTTPTISGTSDPNQEVVVTITDDGGNVVEVLNPIADMSGNWTVDASALADGAYTVDAVATDVAGNTTPAGPNNFVVDNTPPPITLDEPANVSVTNDDTPTVAGTTEAGVTVEVELFDGGGNSLGTFAATVDGAGNWSVDLPQQPEGGYSVTATATDAAGNSSTAGPNIFSIDTTPPPVQITAPADGTVSNNSGPGLFITTDPLQNVTYTVTDSQGNVVDSGSGNADVQGDIAFAILLLGDDTYTFTAEVSDSVGNIGTDSVTYILDTAPPAVGIVSPADGSATNDNTPSVVGTAEVGAMITITITDAGGNVVETLMATADANGDWSADAAQLPEGDYAVAVSATDAAGNTAMAGPNGFTIDTMPPALTFDTPADGTVSNNTTPALSGTVDNDSSVVVRVLDAQGNEVQVLATNVLNGAWDANALALPEGTYSLEATATDPAGNTTVVTNTYTVDLTPPGLTLDAPADGSSVNNNTPAVSGTVDNDSTVVVRILDDQGNEVQVLAANVANGAWDASAMMLADGTYTVEATATDPAGNTTTVTNMVTVDTAPPAVSLVTPADGVSLNDATPTVTGTAEAGAMVTITITDAGGNVVETLMATADANGDWSADASALAEGAYTVEATAADAAGNSATSNNNGFTIDLTAPVLTVTSPADMTSINDDTPTLTGTAEPGQVVTIEITDAGGNVVETLTATADANGDWTVDAAQLPEGDYVAQASATDAAGNTGSAMSGFTVDVTEPGITITAPTDGEVFGTRQVDVTGTTEAGADVSVNLVDAQGMVLETQTATADANGDWSVSFQGIANGDYTAEATASDEATNTSTESVTFTIDSDEPNLTVTAPADGDTIGDARPEITGTSDADATITVIITDGDGNEVANFTTTPDANGDWTATPDQDLPEGDYTISVTATRPNGKSTTVDRDVTVDLTAPNLAITAPTDGLITNVGDVTITGTSDPEQVVQVTVTDAGGAEVFSGDVTADANGDWSVDVTGLADGDYTVDAVAADEAGNEATAGPVSFTVNTGAPTITITSPAPGEEIDSPTPTISGTAEPGATVEIFIDGEKVDEVTAGEDGTWTYEVTEDLGEGDHTVEARTTNEAGSEGSSGEVSFTIAGDAPLVITSPTDGEDVEGPDVTITGTGEPGTEVTVTAGGETQTVTVDEDGNWSVTFEDLPDGETTVEASAGDDSVTVTVTVVPGMTDDASDSYALSGGCGDCTTASNSTGGPAPLGLMLLALVGLGWRRRREI
jgi:MYXO-CTERM domain-containing protein